MTTMTKTELIEAAYYISGGALEDLTLDKLRRLIIKDLNDATSVKYH